MQAARILPDLQASIICEEIRQEITGNLILIGVIGYIQVPQLPIVAPKLFVFNRWTAGIGQFTETVRLIAPDQTTVIKQSVAKFGLNDPINNATNVTLFGQVKFETQGAYYIEILVDEVMKLRFPVPLRVVTPPNQQGQQKAPETQG
ncbi:MAG: hypothetical protein SFY81_06400 [Verrucomicrobiota bacterium]|nr:hypothetical protein [Verrucomicrobiota bacterium]